MSTYASWFHVFDSTRSVWLQDEEEYEFGSHGGAAEFQTYEAALEAALTCIKNNKRLDGDLIVLADHGLVEAE